MRYHKIGSMICMGSLFLTLLPLHISTLCDFLIPFFYISNHGLSPINGWLIIDYSVMWTAYISLQVELSTFQSSGISFQTYEFICFTSFLLDDDCFETFISRVYSLCSEKPAKIKSFWADLNTNLYSFFLYIQLNLHHLN